MAQALSDEVVLPARKADALAVRTVRENVTVAGRWSGSGLPACSPVGVLGSEHPCDDDTALLVSDLFENSVRHSGLGVARQTVTIAVSAADGAVWVEVTDRRGRGCHGCGHLTGTRKAAGGRAVRPVRLAATRRADVTWF